MYNYFILVIKNNSNLLNLKGHLRELNPGPLAPKARIIPLDQGATLPVGIEPTTFRLTAERSDQLSYRRLNYKKKYIKVLLGLEPRTKHSKCSMITIFTTKPKNKLIIDILSNRIRTSDLGNYSPSLCHLS